MWSPLLLGVERLLLVTEDTSNLTAQCPLLPLGHITHPHSSFRIPILSPDLDSRHLVRLGIQFVLQFSHSQDDILSLDSSQLSSVAIRR